MAEIDAVILASGLGRRMGCDKLLQAFAGSPAHSFKM